jgi:hypothetical protein
VTKSHHRWIVAAIGFVGAAGCTVAVGLFLLKMLHNGLPWRFDQTAREHYLAVGRAYSGGFATGFFLCFFLTLLVVAGAAWIGQRRGRARHPSAAAESRLRSAGN